MYRCKVCESEFDTLQGLGGHAKAHKHNKQTSKQKKRSAEVQAKLQAIEQVKGSRISSEVQADIVQAGMQAEMQADEQAGMQAGTLQAELQKPQADTSNYAWLNTQLDKPVTAEEMQNAKQELDKKYLQMQELAVQEKEKLKVPAPPSDNQYIKQPSISDKIAGSIDWNQLANTGMNLLSEIMKERRMAKSGPSLAEQIGSLAISNFASTLSKERGKAVGKIIPENNNDELVTKPVLDVMLGRMTQDLQKEREQRKELVTKWEGLENQLKTARNNLNSPSAEVTGTIINPKDSEEDTTQEHKSVELQIKDNKEVVE